MALMGLPPAKFSIEPTQDRVSGEDMQDSAPHPRTAVSEAEVSARRRRRLVVAPFEKIKMMRNDLSSVSGDASALSSHFALVRCRHCRIPSVRIDLHDRRAKRGDECRAEGAESGIHELQPAQRIIRSRRWRRSARCVERSSTCTDDGGSCMQPSSGGNGRWILRQPQAASVKMFGALRRFHG